MRISHSIVMRYDFSGAIDYMYSSLVASLAVSVKFGDMRLWEDRAEFEHLASGTCGVRKVESGSGLAHLDIYFEEKTVPATRDLFVSFIEDHLQESGVDIYEDVTVTCKCGFTFASETIRKRLEIAKRYVICPECEHRTTIAEGERTHGTPDPDLQDAHGL